MPVPESCEECLDCKKTIKREHPWLLSDKSIVVLKDKVARFRQEVMIVKGKQRLSDCGRSCDQCADEVPDERVKRVARDFSKEFKDARVNINLRLAPEAGSKPLQTRTNVSDLPDAPGAEYLKKVTKMAEIMNRKYENSGKYVAKDNYVANLIVNLPEAKNLKIDNKNLIKYAGDIFRILELEQNELYIAALLRDARKSGFNYWN